MDESLIIKFGWHTDIGSVIGATQVLYPLYRKYGGRKFFLWFIGLFKGQNVNIDKIIEIVEAIINDNAVLVDEQKENIHTALVDNLKK